MNYDVQKFADNLARFNRGYSLPEKFADFCQVSYLSLSLQAPRDEDHDDAKRKLLAETFDKYDDPAEQVMEFFGELLGQVIEALSQGQRDFLGEVAEEINILNPRLGQFFTPYSISQMTAHALIGASFYEKIDHTGYVSVLEPAIGSGSLALAIAELLDERDYSPSSCLWIEGVELNRTAFHMAYIQLALRGLSGRIVHGNSITQEVYSYDILPATVNFFDTHGEEAFTNMLRAKAFDILPQS